MQEYYDCFIDKEYPIFIDKYLKNKTLERLKYITQFCGCDYTKLYSPLFMYTRFDHSLVVAHMTWHFTHDKKETIAALLHDIGTPCFAHTIDYVFGDYLKQESSEKNIIDMINLDDELLNYLKEDNINLSDLANLSNYPILENNSPKLCTDRLDGVLHTCYIWLHTNSLEEIKEVYDNITVLINEDGNKEIGFKDILIAKKYALMVYTYAKELQGNTDKYVMKYISEIIKLAVENNLLTLDDLYKKKESEIINIFKSNFQSWDIFCNTDTLVSTDLRPNNFYVSVDTKKRNVIPLVKTLDGNERIIDILDSIKDLYLALDSYKDSQYAYVKKINNI